MVPKMLVQHRDEGSIFSEAPCQAVKIEQPPGRGQAFRFLG